MSTLFSFNFQKGERKDERPKGRGRERGDMWTEGKGAWMEGLVLLAPLPQHLYPEGSPLHGNAWSTTQPLSPQPLK